MIASADSWTFEVIAAPSLEAVGVLAILVAVRIALSFSLDIEIDGVAPWRKKETAAKIEALHATESGDDGS